MEPFQYKFKYTLGLIFSAGPRTVPSMAISKTEENKLRRKAARRGLILSKSGRRDPGGLDYGRYALMSARTGELIHPLLDGLFAHALTLDEVEAALVDQRKPGA